MAEPRFARDPTGQLFRLDTESGRWMPASDAELAIALNPISGGISAFIEGAVGIPSIADALAGTGGPESVSSALRNVRPGTSALGFAATVAPAALKAPGAIGSLLKGAGARATRNTQTASDIAGLLKQEGGPAITQQFKRRPGLIPGSGLGAGDVDPGFLNRTAGAFKNLGQNLIEKSQILRGAFGRGSPNIARQFETNIHAGRGAGAIGSDFNAAGGLTRQGAGRIVTRNDEAFQDAFLQKDLVIDPRSQVMRSIRQDIKGLDKRDQALFQDILKKTEMNPEEFRNWRREMSRLTRSDDDVVRKFARQIVEEIDEIAKATNGIDEVLWQQAQETWRFIEAMIAGLGKEGGNISFPAWKAKLIQMFPQEMGIGRQAERTARGTSIGGQRPLSDTARDTIKAAQEIEFQGGVTTPADQISAIDFILAGSVTAGVGGGGLIGAGVFR